MDGAPAKAWHSYTSLTDCKTTRVLRTPLLHLYSTNGCTAARACLCAAFEHKIYSGLHRSIHRQHRTKNHFKKFDGYPLHSSPASLCQPIKKKPNSGAPSTILERLPVKKNWGDKICACRSRGLAQLDVVWRSWIYIATLEYISGIYRGYSDTRFFSRGPSMRLVSIAALGTGRSPFSSGCSPSAQTLLSRAQSRSVTFFHSFLCANQHFLTRPSWRGPLVKLRRR